MKLVLFIGHFKTGSTSLQRFFCRNYVTLLQNGILYPSVESQGIARNVSALNSGKDFIRLADSLNVTEPHNALALRLLTEENGHGVPSYYPNIPSGFQILNLVCDQINEVKPNSTILCSEVFSLFGLTKERESIKRLANRFKEHEVTLYVNIRRPDEYISSWHRQRLKFGVRINALRGKAFPAYLKTAHFRHDELIQGWLDYFPDANLIVRNYEEALLSGGTIVDFLDNCGITFPKNMVNPGSFNKSVPCAFAEIARRSLNDFNTVDSSAIVHWLISASSEVNYIDDKFVEMFGEHNRDLMGREYEKIHENLSKISGRTPFFENSSEFSQLKPVPDLEASVNALETLRKHARETGLKKEYEDWLVKLRIW